MTWLGVVPWMRGERHFDGRVVRCFADRPLGFDAMLRAAAIGHPAAEALVSGGDRLSYVELDHVVDRLAADLTVQGIAPGDRVAILLENGIPFVIVLAAIVRIGAIAVLLNIREEQPELAYVLDHSGSVGLFYSSNLTMKVPPANAVPDLHKRFIVGDDWLGQLRAVPRSVSPRPHAACEEDVAAILYTSGTTGRPKGAMLTNLGLAHAAMIYEACMGLGGSERSIVSVPMSHVTGLTAAIAAMLRVAGTLIIMPTFKADTFIALAAAERMTHTVMVPAMYNLCLLQPEFQRADLLAWRIGAYGGAPMPEVTIARLAERLPGLKLMNAYGSTETTGPVVLMPPALGVARREAVGCAVPPAEILIMDETGREVAAGESGEVWLRAPNVVKGYWRNAERRRTASWRVLAVGRSRPCRRRGLPDAARPHQGHDQSRRLQDLFGRGRECAGGASRHHRGGGGRTAVPRARRTGARLRRVARRRSRGASAQDALRGATGGLQNPGDVHGARRAAAEERQRQGAEAGSSGDLARGLMPAVDALVVSHGR